MKSQGMKNIKGKQVFGYLRWKEVLGCLRWVLRIESVLAKCEETRNNNDSLVGQTHVSCYCKMLTTRETVWRWYACGNTLHHLQTFLKIETYEIKGLLKI